MLKLKNISSGPVDIYDIGLDPLPNNTIRDLEFHGVTLEEVKNSDDINNGLANGTLQVITDEATYSEPFSSPNSVATTEYKDLVVVANLYYTGTVNKGNTRPLYNERTNYTYSIPLLYPISYEIRYVGLEFSFQQSEPNASLRAGQNVPLELRFFKYRQTPGASDQRYFSSNPSTTPDISIDIPQAKEFSLIKLQTPITLEHSTGYKVYVKNKTTSTSNLQKVKRPFFRLYGKPIGVMSNDFYANFQ